MRIIKQSTLAKFAAENPKAKPSLVRWIKLVKATNWRSMNELQVVVPGAVVLNGERARFEVAGGNFRLIASFSFKHQIAFIKFIGTHAEYDRIDALTVAKYEEPADGNSSHPNTSRLRCCGRGNRAALGCRAWNR